MMTNGWIEGAQLIPENKPYKVDGAGRIIVPSHLKNKFNIENGDYLDYYTTFIDGRWFMCVTMNYDEYGNKLDDKGRIIAFADGTRLEKPMERSLWLSENNL